MNDGADKKLLWREKKKTLKKTRQRRLLRVVYATKQVSCRFIGFYLNFFKLREKEGKAVKA